MRPDSFFDEVPGFRCDRFGLTDSQRLDFLDELTDSNDRVVLDRRRGGGWELRSTVNQLDGRIGARHAIDDYARALGYVPTSRRRAVPMVSPLRRVRDALVVVGCVLGIALILSFVACPDPFPEDLRESSSAPLRLPDRESVGTHAAGRTPPASREQSSPVVARRLTGPAPLDGPVLLSKVPR